MCPPKVIETFASPVPTGRADNCPASRDDARRITISYRHMIDLTHLVDESTSVYPGTAHFRHTMTATFDKDNYYSRDIAMSEHTGTHIDAPAHFGRGQPTVEAIPVQECIVPLVVIDIVAAAQKDPDARLQRRDIETWEKIHGCIPPHALVCMHSGWASRYRDPSAFLNDDARGTCHFPGFHETATAFLLHERNVVAIGVDTLSLDHGPSIDFPVHYQWCRAGKWGIENLTNLDAVPPCGATAVIGIPKLTNGSGAPCRVLALV